MKTSQIMSPPTRMPLGSVPTAAEDVVGRPDARIVVDSGKLEQLRPRDLLCEIPAVVRREPRVLNAAADETRRPHVREAIADVEAGVELGQPPSHP
jgi:hypothetical protein